MGVHERNIMFDDHSLTAAICAKFINSSSQTLHRWYSSDILKVDMFRVSKQIIYVHAVVGIHGHGDGRQPSGRLRFAAG